jgi:hypothetical protein
VSCVSVEKRTQCKWYSQRNVSSLGSEVFVAQTGSHPDLEILSRTWESRRWCRPAEIATEATVQRVEELIWDDRWITIDSVATVIWCSHRLACSKMQDRFKFRKLCAKWVPRELKDREKMNQMGLSLQHLLRYADQGDDTSMLNGFVTGDESRMHHYQPELKCASMQWKHPSSNSTKKFKVTSRPSAGNVMLTVFWDSQEILLAHCQKRDKIRIVYRSEKFYWSFGMQFAGNVHVNWQEGHCFVMTMPDTIQSERPRTEFKNYSGDFLNIRLTALTWPLVTSICLVR